MLILRHKQPFLLAFGSKTTELDRYKINIQFKLKNTEEKIQYKTLKHRKLWLFYTLLAHTHTV